MTKTNIRLVRDVTAPEWHQPMPRDEMLEGIGLTFRFISLKSTSNLSIIHDIQPEQCIYILTYANQCYSPNGLIGR